MSILKVRDLDPVVMAKVRERAVQRGHSVEVEVRQILMDAVASEDQRAGVADSILRHFADLDADLDLPERATTARRNIDL